MMCRARFPGPHVLFIGRFISVFMAKFLQQKISILVQSRFKTRFEFQIVAPLAETTWTLFDVVFECTDDLFPLIR